MTIRPDLRRKGATLVITAAIAALAPILPTGLWPTDMAWAQSHTGGSSGGHDDEEHDDSTHTGGPKGPGGQHGSGGQGAGQGTGQGQGQGQGGPGSTGTKPVWAQEGIPEVELGRLNVARSPDRVLDRAYDEALASLTPSMASFYSMNLQEMVVELSTNFATLDYIDSPLQNLALLKDALDGSSVLTSTGEIVNSNDTLMAAFLGIASDKTVPITPDTVTAITTILGSPVSPSAAQALAAEAEAVRIAILAGHG